MTEILFAETKYGFDWGAMKLERVCSLDDGSVVISIKTPKKILDIRITKTGFIRTYNKDIQK